MRKKQRKPPSKMTVELADRAWQIWQKTPNVEELVRQLHLHRTTCDRLVNVGYPTIAVEPLRARFANVNKKVAERADYTLVTARIENLRILRTCKSLIASKVQVEVAKFNKLRRTDPEALTARIDAMGISEAFKELREIIREEHRLLGDPDQKIELAGTRAAVESFAELSAGWSAEDFAGYAATGKMPAEAKGTA
ncbi:MAG: hypothetical protein WC700_17075 [Gemmatimonadaceae bacterium]|jgi:hypothetical protein